MARTTYARALAERLRWAYRQSGLTHREILARMELSTTSTGKVSKWITGREQMPAEHAEGFAAVTGVDAAWLLTGEGEPLGSEALTRAALADDAEIAEAARRLWGEDAGLAEVSGGEDDLRLLLRQLDRSLASYSSEKRAAVRLLLESLVRHPEPDADTTPLSDIVRAGGGDAGRQSLPAPTGAAESSSRRRASRGTSSRRPI